MVTKRLLRPERLRAVPSQLGSTKLRGVKCSRHRWLSE